uniref:Uncharacterized protein n=1 Tax=Perkinsus marinus TaxID=31276 RepID=C9VXM2_9ALVE|nr:unknown protein [Perkinsus marinus]
MTDSASKATCCSSSRDMEDLPNTTTNCHPTAIEEPLPEECRQCPANWVCHYKGPNGDTSGCEDKSWHAFTAGRIIERRSEKTFGLLCELHR